jgi:BirA family biotin operon repressor/biotin-[acetyl-CoA-carboxylase] ligase
VFGDVRPARLMPKPVEFHEAFARALDGVSPNVVTLDETGSTMDDARALAREGAPHLSVVVTDRQRAGRGRLGRAWVSPPRAGLQATWVVRARLPVERWTLVPLMAGVAAAEAVRERTRVRATLKWPNDVLAGGDGDDAGRGARKLGGILVEAEPPEFLLVGLGVNVGHTSFPPELAEVATSVALEGGIRLDRADLLARAMTNFARALDDVEGTLARYRELCATLGRRVRIERSGAEPLEGVARDIDERGALVLDSGEVVASGDVVHLRAT